jgi:tRNA(adenine34) deaminase
MKGFAMNYPLYSDEYFMNEALKEAERASDSDEVPVGAVIVAGNIIIARSHNMTADLNDVTAHAEMIAITAAENYLGSRYLNDCTLYVSLEPCPMCASATRWAQLGRIVYGAPDPRAGYSLLKGSILHPGTLVEKGVLQSECSRRIKAFFLRKRKNIKRSG